MKKSITALLLVHTVLFADVSDLQREFDAEAYEAVIEAAKQRTDLYGDVQLHLLWAKSAEALGADEMAMSAYERVLLLDPDNTEVRVHLALLYDRLSRDKLAKEMRKSTENYQLTPAQRASLERLQVKDELQKVRASASMGIGYDTNINVSPGDLDLIDGEEEISTMFVQLQGSLSYTHDLEEKGGWYLRADGALFYQNNIDASLYNLFVGSLGGGVGYSTGSFDLYLPASHSRVRYLDRALLQSNSLDPRINFGLSPSFILNANARFTQRKYTEDVDEKRDDTIIGGGLGLYWLFSRDFAYLKVNYDDYAAEHSDSLPFTDKETITLSLGMNYHFRDYLITRFDYRYRNAAYADRIEAGGDERSDDYHQAEVKVSKMFLDHLEGSLLYRYIRNDSNYALAEYDKDIIMLGLKYDY